MWKINPRYRFVLLPGTLLLGLVIAVILRTTHSLPRPLPVAELRAAEGDNPALLLEAAQKELQPRPSPLPVSIREKLEARIILHEAASDLKQARDKAAGLRDPFCASLALGGLAAVALPRDSAAAESLYRQAVERALTIKNWNGEHGTSLTFLYTLLPRFPLEQGQVLLDWSLQKFLARDRNDDLAGGYALVELAKATTAVNPAAAHDLLFDVAVKCNHYWAASDYLGEYLAGENLEGTLREAHRCYESLFGGSAEHALWSVYFIMADKDFDRALEGIWKMRHPENEIAALLLARRLLDSGRRDKANRIVEMMKTEPNRRPKMEWSQRTLRELSAQLSGTPPAPQPTGELIIIPPIVVDAFIHSPTPKRLERLSLGHRVLFRDRKQAAQFLAAALPLADEAVQGRFHGDMKSHFGFPHEFCYGFLAGCAALAGDIPQAVRTARRARDPHARASYLLEAYAALRPLPEPLDDWPLHVARPSAATLKRPPGEASDDPAALAFHNSP